MPKYDVISYRARRADHEQALVFMVLDVLEETGGRFNIWGKTDYGQAILVRVHDFMPYFYMAQPTLNTWDSGQAPLYDHTACAQLQQALNGCEPLIGGVMKHRILDALL